MTDQNVINMNEKKPPEWSKYTKTGILLVIIFVLLLTVITNLFIVREGEYKVVRQFGEVVKFIPTPGLAYKIPFIQTVETLPKYQMVFEVQKEEINTRDKKRMTIDNYAVWRIEDPKQMIASVRNVLNAEAKMGEFIFSVVRAELGQLNYDEIINDEKSSRGSLNDRVTDRVNELLKEAKYGIAVTDVRIKRTDLPSENEQSVFTRMVSERESTAQQYLSMGDAEKNRLIANTDREVTELLAKAKADAELIRSEGEAQAARVYNEAFSQDQQFYDLYRTLETYRKTINGDTVIIIPSDSPYARILTGYLE